MRRKLRVEENIRLVESGRLQIPEGADVVTFLLSDGNLTKKSAALTSSTLTQLFSRFFEELPENSLESSTITTMKVHQRHLERSLGKRFVVQSLTHDDLQKYATKRFRQKTRRGTVSGDTIKKEIVTLRTVWKWEADAGLLQGEFPKQRLRLPKAKELPSFQTWDEIERQIAQGASSELWEALYLSMEELGELLDYVREAADFPFIHPMFAFAAYTGARRSEICDPNYVI
ncbi:MAG: hypothetical protein AAGG48_29225 [Planctomycetota bacterium]